MLSAEPATSEFPFKVSYEFGKSEFAPGDCITITSLLVRRDAVTTNETYCVEGNYTLASKDKAFLGFFATVPNSGPLPADPREQANITKGSGTFRLIKPMSEMGYLHVSFYDLSDGNGFGGVYFGQGEWVLQKIFDHPNNLKRQALFDYLGNPVEPPSGLDPAYTKSGLSNTVVLAAAQKCGNYTERKLILMIQEIPMPGGRHFRAGRFQETGGEPQTIDRRVRRFGGQLEAQCFLHCPIARIPVEHCPTHWPSPRRARRDALRQAQRGSKNKKLFLAGRGEPLFNWRSAMRHIRSLLIYFAVVFLGGALLAPWLLLVYSLGSGPLARVARFGGESFSSVSCAGVARTGADWSCAVVARRRNVSVARRAGIECPSGGRFVMCCAGFGVGFVSLAIVAALALIAQGRTLAQWTSSAQMIHSLIGAALSAMIVAVIEEILFRMALCSAFWRKAMPWTVALAVSSAIYSGVHFIQSVNQTAAIRWNSGFILLVEMFRHGPPFIPAFLTLFVAGACLALAYQRTGALYFSMGLHAGWIFWLKSYKLVTEPAAHANAALWGTDKLIDGWMALGRFGGPFSSGVSRVDDAQSVR